MMKSRGSPAMEMDRDRISNLPDSLIHQILTYLPTIVAARTSVLSKTWLQSYYTFPNLIFNEYYFSKSQKIEDNRYSFFNFVDATLFRIRTLNLNIHKFQITLFRLDQPPTYRLLVKSLETAFDYGVKELDFSVAAAVKFSPYTLPPLIFDSPKLLTYFRVYQCKFPQNVVTTSNSDAIVFPFLRTLDLNLADIDDGMLHKLLSNSPLLEKIVLFRVSGFEKFRVSGHGALKIIDIHSSDETIEIDIEDAPSLCFLRYLGSYIRPCSFKVGSTPFMKHLELGAVNISDNFVEQLITKCPLLEDLEIDKCDGLERIDIVSGSLKRLRFRGCSELVEVKVNAPSLLTLHYNGQNMLSLSLNNTSEELKTYIHIANPPLDHLSIAWFHRLRELLKAVTRGRVSFSMLHQNKGVEFGTVHDFRVNPLPLEHQHNFMLEINELSSLFAAFVETLFSSSRPTTMYTCFLTQPLVKFLGSELIIAAKRSSKCCNSNQIKCWRHYLKDVKVEVYQDSQKVWQPLPQETSLPDFIFCGKKFRFSLKWGISILPREIS